MAIKGSKVDHGVCYWYLFRVHDHLHHGYDHRHSFRVHYHF